MGQNKNWYLCTAFANEVNSENSSSKAISLKYFEPSHTFMSADSFHQLVKQRMFQSKTVEDFQDFVRNVDSCGKSLLMNFNVFFEIPKRVIQAKYTCNKPKLEDVQVVNFVRGSAQMFRKTSYTEENLKSFRKTVKLLKFYVHT